MLTLKQLLESDSLATIVAKLNQNLQVISNSNGGPQGIRGPQGIPGLPGKIGPIGPTGAVGPTGTILGIVPFAETLYDSSIAGPLFDTFAPYGKIGPWPISSLTWLTAYHTPTAAGEIYLDHRNNGYWKYLTAPDVDGAAYPGNTNGNPYQYAANSSFVYPNLGDGSNPPTSDPGFYAGPGWYFYPVQDSSALGIGQVWVEDYSTYTIKNLQGGTGPYAQGPTGTMGAGNLKIPNARLVTKYGTVWITSGNDASASANDGTLKTSLIGKWGEGPGLDNSQPGRYSSGVDRLFFKMSIDGLSFLNNVAARGYTGPATMLSPVTDAAILDSVDFPVNKIGDSFSTTPEQFWVKPQYEVTIDKYTPLLFLSHRNDEDDPTKGTYGTLGIYMFTDVSDNETTNLFPQPAEPYGYGDLNYNNVSKTLHLFTSRYAPDPLITWDPVNSPLSSNQTVNYGEMILDFRRVIASNQYVCSLPSDMKLSSDYRTGANGNYVESSGSNLGNSYRTYQGFVSAINGKSLTGDINTPYQWEYGLGDGTPYGATAGNHDTSSGTLGMLTRRTWYGTSVLSESQFSTLPAGTNDYIRNAGMLERGRRFTTTSASGGGSAATGSYFLSELVFYTSQFKVTGATGGTPISDSDLDPQENDHNSLPSLYVSPFRNIGIGTFVGATGGVDLGPLEPSAKMHVHVKENSRSSDPTFTYFANAAGTNSFATLPTKVFAAAAFSGQVVNSNRQALTDILLGNIVTTTDEKVIPTGNVVNQVTVDKFRNAVRTESWRNSTVSSMHLGAQPYAMNVTIGRNGVEAYRKEFQITLAPLNLSANTTTGFAANTGVGIHNLYPRARFHMYGKNTYNETEFGQELWTPGYTIAGSTSPGLGTTYPFYGATATNTNSANQVVIDYLGSTYNYPVGIYEYQYYVFPTSASANLGNPTLTSPYSANAAVYPNRDSIAPTRNAVPYGGVFNSNLAFPSIATPAVLNNSYKHGGTGNAFWDPQSYIGFNLYRDLSSANGGASTGQNTTGDNQDNARWILGTQGATAVGHGNNGGAAIISSSHGELGIITIPRGRDGGRAYEQWEQRGLGTRDVLSHMKIVFDKNGNIAVGNAAGWDLDAYPSLDLDIDTGYVNYLPTTNADTVGPVSALISTQSTARYGSVLYAGYTESSSISTAALINKRATRSEYVRLEVAAEKAWSRDGRLIQKKGFGYPPNSTIIITGSTLTNYIRPNFTGLPYTPNVSSWTLKTDFEGRIISSIITYNVTATLLAVWNATPITGANYTAVVYPHPTEFNATGPLASLISISYIAPPGAIAAEWLGMSDNPSQFDVTINATTNAGSGSSFTQIFIDPVLTVDLRGSANVRLNNFVYGEGFGFSGGNDMSGVDDNTKIFVRSQRQKSPKLILSFLETNPSVSRTNTGITPYKKVNTVIASAQNEASLREYWIPKTDNTGGTFMVFTDHFGGKEKESGFDKTSVKIGEVTPPFPPGPASTRVGLHLEEVVTQEFLAGYTGANLTNLTSIEILNKSFLNQENGLPVDMYPGYVRYYNTSYNTPALPKAFANTIFGELVDINPVLTSSYTDITRTGASLPEPDKSSFAIRANAGAAANFPIMVSSQATYNRSVTYWMGATSCSATTSGADAVNRSFGFADGSNQLNETTFSTSVDTYATNSITTSGTNPGALQSNGKFVAPQTGTYEIKYSVVLATSPLPQYPGYANYVTSIDKCMGNIKYECEGCNLLGCDWSSSYCDGASQEDDYRDMKLIPFINGNNEAGPAPGYPNIIGVQWPFGCGNSADQAYLATLKDNVSEVTIVRNLNAGDTFHIETTWDSSGRWQIREPGGDCSDTRMWHKPMHKSVVKLQIKYLDAACQYPQPLDTNIQMSLGETKSTLDSDDWTTAANTPDTDYFPCATHTFINTSDTKSITLPFQGSVADYVPGRYVSFYKKPINYDYDKVKITINFAGRSPSNNDKYDFNNKVLGLRLNYYAGRAFYYASDLSQNFAEGTGDVLIGMINGKQTTDNKYVYDGEVELYISKSLWESWGNTLFLSTALLPNNPTYPKSEWQFASIDADFWDINRLTVTFEVLSKNAGNASVTETDSISNTGTNPNRASIRRNIDMFYDIYSPTTNYDNGWNNNLSNKASEFRMKRINSEFALIDYNITVKVTNPWVGTNAETSIATLMDFGSPRFTQYLRFVYIPDEEFWNEAEYAQDIAQKLYGNGMWFNNWSSYKNWYSGTAIVGDDINNTQFAGYSQPNLGNRANYDGGDVGFSPRNVSSDWSPTFFDKDQDSISPSQPFNRGWNGNVLEMLAFKSATNYQEMGIFRASSDYSILSNPLQLMFNEGQDNAGPGQSVLSAFGNDGRMLRASKVLFNWVDVPNTNALVTNTTLPIVKKQKAFVGYLGAMYALWGNQAFERNTNTQWRLSPMYGYAVGTGLNTVSPETKNNGFILEVQFSNPILHTDTPLGAGYYGFPTGFNATRNVVQPYRFLTVSGQAIVRYAQTNK